MARQRATGSGEPDLLEAAALFDGVCRLLNRAGYRNNSLIGRCLGGHSRKAVSDWRRGVTEVPTTILFRACRFAGVAIAPGPNMRLGGPQLYGLVPLAGGGGDRRVAQS